MRRDVLELLDNLAADERSRLSTAEVREQLGLSSQAATNLLSRLVRDGLLDHVARGVYTLRPFGVLGTRAASESTPLAVGAVFGGQPHRIAYRSALDHHGLLVHPVRTIQVALPRRTKLERISGRRLQPIVESPDHIGIGSQAAGHDAFVSTVERALLESANRPHLAGGWLSVAEAVSHGSWDPKVIRSLARDLDAEIALRRFASIAEQSDHPELAARLPKPKPTAHPIPLDPREPSDEPWLDARWQVRWPMQPDRARELVGA